MINTNKQNESALIKSLYNDMQIIGNVKAKDLFYISDYREIYKLLGFTGYDDSGVHIFVNRVLKRIQTQEANFKTDFEGTIYLFYPTNDNIIESNIGFGIRVNIVNSSKGIDLEFQYDKELPKSLDACVKYKVDITDIYNILEAKSKVLSAVRIVLSNILKHIVNIWIADIAKLSLTGREVLLGKLKSNKDIQNKKSIVGMIYAFLSDEVEIDSLDILDICEVDFLQEKSERFDYRVLKVYNQFNSFRCLILHSSSGLHYYIYIMNGQDINFTTVQKLMLDAHISVGNNIKQYSNIYSKAIGTMDVYEDIINWLLNIKKDKTITNLHDMILPIKLGNNRIFVRLTHILDGVNDVVSVTLSNEKAGCKFELFALSFDKKKTINAILNEVQNRISSMKSAVEKYSDIPDKLYKKVLDFINGDKLTNFVNYSFKNFSVCISKDDNRSVIRIGDRVFFSSFDKEEDFSLLKEFVYSEFILWSFNIR